MNEYIQLPTRAKDIKSKRFGRLVALGINRKAKDALQGEYQQEGQ